MTHNLLIYSLNVVFLLYDIEKPPSLVTQERGVHINHFFTFTVTTIVLLNGL